jgi:hypothetical protein
MKQIAQYSLLAVALAGCTATDTKLLFSNGPNNPTSSIQLVEGAATDTKPVFSNAPTYPTTSIQLASGKNLTHLAGRPCTTEERPEVGVSDRERTFSEWHLGSGADQKPFVKAPSFLSDPKYSPGSEVYYRSNDLVDVFESASGNTVVIVEDRSPTFPRRAYLLLRGDAEGNWSSQELLLENYLPADIRGPGDPAFRGPLDYKYPEILEVTDSHLRYTSKDGSIRVAIKDLPTKER